MSSRKIPPPPAPSVTSWDALPLMVPIEMLCELYGLTKEGVQRRVRMRRLPAPVVAYPMRWSRADLQRHWEGRSTAAAPRLRSVRSA